MAKTAAEKDHRGNRLHLLLARHIFELVVEFQKSVVPHQSYKKQHHLLESKY